MKYLQPKSPDSTRFYVIDYSKLLGSDAIASWSIEVTSGSASIVRTVFNFQAIGFMVEGGIVDETCSFTITINTIARQVFPDTTALYIVANEDDLDYSVVTKQQIITFARQDLRLSGYTFDLSPDELQAMLDKLDALMRTYSCLLYTSDAADE